MRKITIVFSLMLIFSCSFAEPFVSKQAKNTLRQNTLEIGADYSYETRKLIIFSGEYFNYINYGRLLFRYALTDEVEMEASGSYLHKLDNSYMLKSWGTGPFSIGGKFCFFQTNELSITYGFNMDLPLGDSRSLLVEGFNIFPYFAWDVNLNVVLLMANAGFNMKGEYIDVLEKRIKEGDEFIYNLVLEIPVEKIRIISELNGKIFGRTRIDAVDQDSTSGQSMNIVCGIRYNIEGIKLKACGILPLLRNNLMEFDWKIIGGLSFLINL